MERGLQVEREVPAIYFLSTNAADQSAHIQSTEVYRIAEVINPNRSPSSEYGIVSGKGLAIATQEYLASFVVYELEDAGFGCRLGVPGAGRA